MKGSLLSTEIAEPYAQALMALAQSGGLIERLGEDTRSLLALLEDSPELREFIGNPIIKESDKKAVLQQVVGESGHPYFLNFLMLLVDKRRIVFLEAIAQQYLVLLRKLNQAVLAEITSATPLNEEQRQAVSDKVRALTSARAVELKTTVDPDLIGGVIIKVGSQVFDASLRGQLRRISLNLNRAA